MGELKEENWDRFLPHFKKRNIQRKKQKIKKKKSKEVFPPQQTPRKEDLQMETGEFFLDEQERDSKKRFERREAMKANSAAKRKERAKEYDPAIAAANSKKRPKDKGEAKESTQDMASRLIDKAAASKTKKKKGKD